MLKSGIRCHFTKQPDLKTKEDLRKKSCCLKIIDPFTSDGEATSSITNASVQFKQIQNTSLEWQDHRGGGFPLSLHITIFKVPHHT